MENRKLSLEEFEAAIEKTNTVEEVIDLYKSQGVDVTEEELKEMAGPDNGEELTEEALEDVAGGAVYWRVRVTYCSRRIVVRVRRIVYRRVCC